MVGLGLFPINLKIKNRSYILILGSYEKVTNKKLNGWSRLVSDKFKNKKQELHSYPRVLYEKVTNKKVNGWTRLVSDKFINKKQELHSYPRVLNMKKLQTKK